MDQGSLCGRPNLLGVIRSNGRPMVNKTIKLKTLNNKMNIRQTIITATVALTMAALIAPAAAGAVTASDLQAQIAALQAQLNSVSGSSSSVPAACVGVTFSRNLRVGSTGQDVMCFQVLLNTHGYVLASVGAGSPGHETMYFGPRTLASVRAWQVAQGWTPANQVGPLSRARFNAWLQGSTTGQANNPTPPVQTQTGPVTAMLSSDNPASGNIVGSQASADLLHVTFSGSGTVTSVTLTRTGISDQNLFTNVYLYDGAVRITDGYSFNTNGTITINNLSIPVNGSHTIQVRGDVEANASATEGNVVVSLTSFTANSTAATVNVMGNTMFVVSASLATVNFNAANTSTGTPSINAGTLSYIFWSQTVQVNTRTVWLKAANFRMVGSAPSNAVGNIHMFVDGVDTGIVATISQVNGSNYATFNLLANPLSLSTGAHTIDVRGDILTGVNRTVQFSIQQASDLMIFDQQVGVNIALGTSGAGVIPSAGANVTIAKGSPTVTIDPAFNAITNITGGGSSTVIGRFIVHAYGDSLKITSLTIAPVLQNMADGGTDTTGATGICTLGTCGLQNVALFFNGAQVGTQSNIASTAASNNTFDGSTTTKNYSLGSQMIAPAGQDSVLEVRADIMNTNATAYTSGTIGVNIISVTGGATSQGSQDTVNFPTANVTGHTATIQTGTLSVSKDSGYGNQTVAPNATGVKIASFVFQNQSSSESVRVTNLAVKLNYGAGTQSTNFSAFRTDETSGSGSTPIQPTSCLTATPCSNATDNFSVNFTLAPGATKTIGIWVNSGANAGSTVTVEADMNASYTGVSSNVSSTSGFKTGPTITFNTGTLGTIPTLVTSTSSVAQYIASLGGATDGSRNTFNISSSSGASTISELKFTVTGTSTGVSSIRVGSISAPVATGLTGVAANTGVAYLSNLSITVPNGGSGLNLDAYATYPDVSINGILSGSTATVKLASIKYTSGGVTSILCAQTDLGTTQCPVSGTTNMNSGSAVAANAMTLVGSKPAVALGLPNGATGSTMAGFGTGTKYVADITITANAKGDIKVNAIPLTFNTTSTSSVAPSSALNVKDSTGTVISNASVGSITGNGTASATALVTFTNGYLIPAGTSQTFRIEVSVTSAAGTGNSIATGIGSAGSFTWTDVAGNGTSAAGTGSLITNFPTSTVSLTN